MTKKWEQSQLIETIPIIYYILITTVYYSPLPVTLSIAAPTNGRADSVTSAVRVIVIPFVSEPPAFEAAEAASPVRLPNAM